MFTGLPANFLILKFGMRKTQILALIFFSIGNFLKIFVNEYVYFVHIGQFVAGLGCPFVQNNIAFFANHWFKGEAVNFLKKFNFSFKNIFS